MSAEMNMNVPDTLEFLRFMNELKVNLDVINSFPYRAFPMKTQFIFIL